MKRLAVAAILLFPVVMLVFWVYLGTTLRHDMATDADKKSTAERLAQYGPAARARMQPFFTAAGVAYPPARVSLVALKDENVLEVYAANSNRPPVLLHTYPILATSGKPGPKLREGDEQVPEGVYPIEFLNPNSKFHLALRLGYPNEFDRTQALREGRENLGGDIMIHGGAASVGCIAIGDQSVEDVFVLVADVGTPNVTVIVSPVDFRKAGTVAPAAKGSPDWAPSLYQIIKSNLDELPLSK